MLDMFWSGEMLGGNQVDDLPFLQPQDSERKPG